MAIKQQIDADLKTAMLGGDKVLAMTLRGLKSSILNAEIAKGARDSGLPETEIIDVLSKEAKKRVESAELYAKGGNQERQAAELAEKAVIDKYLPAQMSDDEINKLLDEAEQTLGSTNQQNMGQIIGLVKQKSAGSADGAKIASLVRQRMS